MTEATGTDMPPTERVEALVWLIQRHPYLDNMLCQIDADDPVDAAFGLPAAFNGEEEGPGAIAHVIAPMSGGEQRALRAVAFLTGRVPVGIEDLHGVTLTGSHTDFFDDWLHVVAVGAGRW